MKKIIFITISALISLYGYSQVKDDVYYASNTENTKNKNASKHIYKLFHVGMGMGYTSEGHMPVTFHVTYKKVHMGLSFAVPLNDGRKGEHYSTINWNEIPEDHVKEGYSYTPYTIDLGYDIRNLTIGIGGGFASRDKYLNCYDNLHILGNNGSYHITSRDGTVGEYKVFAKYRFASKSSLSIGDVYLSAMYSKNSGFGGLIGFEF